MSNRQKILEYIKENPTLFWYIPRDKLENISEDFLLESVLNYGTFKDCIKIIRLIGYKESYQILKNAKGRKKGNYFPEIYNYFTLYLEKHV